MTEKQPCNENLLTLYHYGELESAQRQQIEVHLAVCAECRAELKELESSLASLSPRGFKMSPVEKLRFTEQVLAKATIPIWRRKPVWGSALAAAGALAITLIVLPGGQQPEPISNPALAELEVLEQLELLQELELLEDLEILEELEDLG